MDEFERLQEALDNKQFLSRSQIRARIYNEFVTNCSNYIIGMTLNDKVVSLDDDNQVIYVHRHNKLFQKRLDPKDGSSQTSLVRLKVHEVDHQSRLEWPSTHWIFADPPDPQQSQLPKPL